MTKGASALTSSPAPFRDNTTMTTLQTKPTEDPVLIATGIARTGKRAETNAVGEEAKQPDVIIQSLDDE